MDLRMTFSRFLVLAVLATGVPAGTLAAADNPNVLIIYSDDQGTLDAGCYGSADIHTPAIDGLASRGVRFTQAYAHTVCCPSRAALMTGRHPQRTGINSWAQRAITDPDGINMSLDEVTLAEVFQQAGYRTALFGKWHLGSHRDHGPTRQGFDEFFGIRDGFIDNHNHFFLHADGFHDLFEGTEEVFARGQFFPEMITERSLEFLQQNRRQPFFLYLAYNTPHYPEQAPRRDLKHYRDVAEPRRSYGAFITTTDRLIGRVLDKLDALKLTDNTVVIFMSDNGHSEEDYQIRIDNHNSGYPRGHDYGPHGGGGNTGKWIGHKGTFLEGGVRTPAIISLPGTLPQNVVRNQAITTMDWFPTLLDICQLTVPQVELDGRNILPLINDPDMTTPHKQFFFQWQQNWAVREGDWKLIRTRGRQANSPEILSLHQLTGESPEATDHADGHPEIVRHLQQLYTDWATDVFSGK